MRSDIQTSTVGDRSSATDRPRDSAASTSRRSAPLGLKIIVFFGFLDSLIGGLLGLALFAVSPILALLVLGLVVGQMFVLVGLLKLQAWAFTLAAVLYMINLVINLVTMNPVGILVSVIILVYLGVKSDLFQ